MFSAFLVYPVRHSHTSGPRHTPFAQPVEQPGLHLLALASHSYPTVQLHVWGAEQCPFGPQSVSQYASHRLFQAVITYPSQHSSTVRVRTTGTLSKRVRFTTAVLGHVQYPQRPIYVNGTSRIITCTISSLYLRKMNHSS